VTWDGSKRGEEEETWNFLKKIVGRVGSTCSRKP
jgi:hypothetical protein